MDQSDHFSCFHWCLIKKVCNHQTYGRLLEKLPKTVSFTWGNGNLTLAMPKSLTIKLESWCRPNVAFGRFWCTSHQSVKKKTHQFFNQNQNGLKNPSVYGQNGVKAPRLMGYVVKHARCSGLTATSI